MDDTDYVKSRDALARLVEDLGKEPAIEAVTVARRRSNAPEEAGEVPVAEELAALRERLSDERFRIGLYTPSQRGKSTTFNALFGGQELSPRGQGTATSAAIVVGVPTRDPGRVGKATVAWKTKKELLLSLKAALIAPYLPKGRLAEGQSLDDLDLDRDEDLRALCDAVEDAWRDRRQGKLSDEDYDRLRIAYVMLHHYGNQTLREQWARPKETLHEAEAIAGIVRYPEHWEEHFDTSDLPADFRDEETLFLFAKQVTLYVDAATLDEAACAVVDCPGLDANHYDTRVAQEALGACDLVWVILGEKEIGETEEEKIKELAGFKADALLFALNMRGDRENGRREHFREVIVPTAVSKLNGGVLPEGAKVAEADVLLYQAHLALVAEQAARLREGRLPEASLEAIIRHASDSRERCKTTAEALDVLRKQARTDLYNLGGFKRSERDKLTFEGEEGAQWVARAREAGGLEDVRARIVAIVRGQRIGRVLRDNVCARLCTAFDVVSSGNKRRLEDLRGGIAVAEKRVAEKEDEAKAFKERVDALFGSGQNLRKKLRDDLRRELQREVFGPAAEAVLAEARRECAALADKNEDRLQAWFNTVCKRQTETKLKAWQTKVKDGGSPALKAYLEAIRAQVGDLFKDVDAKRVDGADVGEISVGGLSVDLGFDWGFWLDIANFASTPLLFTPFGWIVGLGVLVANALSWLFGKSKADKMREAVDNEIAPKLREGFRDAAGEMAKKMAEETSNRVRDTIDKQIARYRRTLERELADLHEAFAGERGKVDAEIAFRAEAQKRLEAFGQRLEAVKRDLESAIARIAQRAAS